MSNDDFLNNLPPEDDAGATPEPAVDPALRVRPRHVLPPVAVFTMRDAIRLLLKHKWTLSIPFIVFTVAGVLYTRSAVPWYQASARLQIKPSELEGFIPTAGSVINQRRNLLNDQVETMISDKILARAVEALSLDTQIHNLFEEDMHKGDRVTRAIQILRDRLLSIRPIMDTNFIVVTGMYPEPVMAARIANTVAGEYITDVEEEITAAAESIGSLYDTDVAEKDKELKSINSRIDRLLLESGVVDLYSFLRSKNAELETLKQERRITETELKRLTVQIEAQQARLESEPREIIQSKSITTNPQYTQIEQYIEQLRIERNALLTKYREDWRGVKELDAQIAEAAEILTAMEQEIISGKVETINPVYNQILANLDRLIPQKEAAEAELEKLVVEVDNLESELTEFGRIRQRYDELLTDRERVETDLAQLKERRDRTESAEKFASEISDAKLVDDARTPLGPSSPNHLMNILMSMAAGAGLGIGLSVLRELLKRGFETSQEVHKSLRIPVLGQIPEKAIR